LEGRWAIAAVTPGRARCPADLETLDLDWLACDGPMTAAAALRAAGQWDAERSRNFDADDWWYRCRFTLSDEDSPVRLHFQGLATRADVWLNGTPILHSTSMFVAHTVDVGHLAGHEHELQLRFHALEPLLSDSRPRPKWRTALVARQQIRHFRTTLLGRTSTWWPQVAPVGPWRPILVEPASPLRVEHTDLRTALDGDDGVVRVALQARQVGAAPGNGVLRVGGHAAPVSCEPRAGGTIALLATVRIPHVERWWPHTHGPQPLYPVELSINVGGDVLHLNLGCTGFRTLEVQRGPDGKGFGLVINNVPVFCRGVCWTPLDIARLSGDAADYRTALEQLRHAGMNIVRVPGTMVYETDDFHDLCDELGLLLWQDFMFANMDYPLAEGAEDNDAFARNVSVEVRQRLEALQGRPSLVVCCGNSEVEQQAAMMGVPRGQWTHALFTDILPALVASLAPDVAWVPSTPTGGAYPFQTDEGVSHYYGVGAYRRALHDVRRAGVRFASECLAFSNFPEEPCLDDLDSDDRARWNQQLSSLRVPRDAGAEWDFAQVRDHYVSQLFGVDASTLRQHDPERYRALGRAAVGEVMLQTFAEWRRPGSSCRGGLVWFARDFSPAAGWGIIDSSGRAKSAYWFLKRALAPIALLAVDEGLNGLALHAINDTPHRLEAELRVALYREGCPFGAPAATRLTIPARSARSVPADRLFDRFHDITNAYRFGPGGHDVVAASLLDPAGGDIVATAHYFPYRLPSVRDSRLQVTAYAEPIDGGYSLVVEADRFAHAVAVEADGFVPDDNYLHLEPRRPRRLVLRAEGRGRWLSGSVSALNGVGSVHIVCRERRDAD
jgi:beta-mannosidase